MKVLFELKNINGNCADVVAPDGQVLMIQWNFPVLPEEYKKEEDEKVSLNKLLKLKEAGFDSDEILKMNNQGML